ncbi:MAG: MEDS domain-containing protein [Actinobacteria bacterium]|nr:MEDS domain-containing protein [Actinomycetota bacterium]
MIRLHNSLLFKENMEARRTGIDIIKEIPWGTHFCQLYNTKDDLIEILVPYFKAGLESNEYCIWVTSESLPETKAMHALAGSMPDLDGYLKKKQLEIFNYSELYTKGGSFKAGRVLDFWIRKLDKALENGFEGIRVTGDTIWLQKNGWKDFTDYEEEINKIISNYKMIVACTYFLGRYGADEIIDIIKNHEFALIKRENKWMAIENSAQSKLKQELINERNKVLDVLNSNRQTTDYLEKLFNYANAPIIVWDPSFKITRFNHAFEHLTGYNVNEVIDRELDVLFPESGREESLNKIRRTLEGEHWDSVEIPIMCKNGNIKVVLWNSANIYGEDEKTIVATIAQGQDITERRDAELELKALNENLKNHSRQLETANKDLEAFSYSLSHDVRKYIRTIDGYSSIIAEEFPEIKNSKNGEYIEKIKGAVKSISKLIDSMLGLYRISNLKHNYEEVNLSDVINEIIDKKDEEYKEYRINYKVESNMLLYSNSEFLKILFENLIDNSCKSLKDNINAKLEIGKISSDNSPTYFVSDNGTGIDSIYHEKIFQPFVSYNTGKGYNSTGIGLAIVKKIVNILNGNICLESELGKGSTFFIRF